MQAHKPSVLMVDDDGILRNVVKAILRGDGFRVIDEAASGEAALARCAHQTYDLILLDLQLPGQTGLQVLPQLRLACPHAKILVVSADSTLNQVLEAIQQGAAGFVVKPITTASLLNKINQCFAPPAPPVSA